MPSSQPPLTVTIDDAKKITGLGHSFLCELIRDRRVKTTSVGRRRLIFYASLQELLAENADQDA
jgi:hypothetical protein